MHPRGFNYSMNKIQALIYLYKIHRGKYDPFILFDDFCNRRLDQVWDIDRCRYAEKQLRYQGMVAADKYLSDKGILPPII